MFTNTIMTSFKTIFVSVTDETKAKEDNNTKYMLAGGGIFLAMFLFVIVLQLYTCKRTKYTKSKVLKQNVCEEIEVTDEFLNDTQNENEQVSSRNNRARNRTKLNALPKSVYDHIEESLESGHSQILSNEPQKYEQQHCLTKPNPSDSTFSTQDCFLLHRMNIPYDEPISGPFNENRSDLYLQPISVRRTADAV